MLTVVSGLCACMDEFDDYDDYDDGYGYDYDDDSDEESDDEADDPTKATDGTDVRSDFDADQYPYFAVLGSKEQDIYSLLYEELSTGSQKFECKKA